MSTTSASAVKTRWYRLIVGAVCMLFAGIIYAWSVLKAPLAAEFGWDPSQLALNFTLTMTFWCIGGFISSQLTRRTSPRVTVLAAAVLVLIGFVLCSRMSDSIGMLYLSYSFLAGTGIGMAYNAVISATNVWFPDKKGTSSGVLMMCFGIGSLILGKVADAMFATPSFGWRKTYLVLGVVIAVILALCGLVQKLPGSDVVLPKPPVKQVAKEEFEVRDYSAGEMLRRATFWKFFAYSVFTAAVGNTVISFARDLSLSVGASAALAVTLAGVLSIFNGLGRILSGILFDALGRRKAMMIGNIAAILGPALLLVTVKSGNLTLCVVGMGFAGISYGFAATTSSVVIGALYGMKHFSTNFSIINLMIIPCSFMATLSSKLLMSTGSYVAPFILLLVLTLAALVLNLSIRKP